MLKTLKYYMKELIIERIMINLKAIILMPLLFLGLLKLNHFFKPKSKVYEWYIYLNYCYLF